MLFALHHSASIDSMLHLWRILIDHQMNIGIPTFQGGPKQSCIPQQTQRHMVMMHIMPLSLSYKAVGFPW